MTRAMCGLALAAGLMGCLWGRAQGAEGWKDLYVGGKDWRGWHTVGGGEWSIGGGEIIGKTGDGRYGWLVTDEVYADFILELECRHEGWGNSGIQFRSHVIEGTMHGWQADFERKLSEGANGVWDEAGKERWLALPKGEAARAVKPDDWNRYRIQAIGDHVKVWINGIPTVEFRDKQFTRGIIALQVHSGKEPPVHVRWRNIRIRVLDENEGFRSLFDGKSLAGWRVAGKEPWKVENGEIVAQCRQGAEYCYLVSEDSYDDFYAKLKFRYESGTGNSGFFFRSSIEGVDIRGPQAEIAPRNGQHTGLVYESGGRGWLNLKEWDKLKDAVYRPDEWNIMEVQAIGPRVVVHVNGWPVSDFSDERLPRQGRLALQMHSGEAMKIRFKDLYIRTLK